MEKCGFDPQKCRFRCDLERQPLFGQTHAAARSHGLEKLLHIHRLHLRRGLFQGEEVEEGVGHGLQALALGEDVVGGLDLLRPGQLPAAQGVGVADDGGEGRLDFVGEGGGEIPLPLRRVLQLPDLVLHGVGHAVEVLRQGAQLVLGVHLRPAGVLSRGHEAGGAGELADGRDEEERHHHRDGCAHGQRA